jgi:hypothetical protein
MVIFISFSLNSKMLFRKQIYGNSEKQSEPLPSPNGVGWKQNVHRWNHHGRKTPHRKFIVPWLKQQGINNFWDHTG